MTSAVEHGLSVAARPRNPNASRLAIFTSHPIQYQAPLFRALTASGRLEPVVFFGSRHGADVAVDPGFGTAFKWDVPLLDGYQHVFLPNVASKPDVSRFGGVRVSNPDAVLQHGDFDALLLLGWQTHAHIQMLRAAWRAGTPVILRGESTLQREPLGGARGAARRMVWLPVRQRLYQKAFNRVDAFLAIGSRNRDYYRSFGVPDAKIFWAPYGVDNDWFSLSESARVQARQRVRSTLAIGEEQIVFASSAKLIARKRPLDLVEAVARVRRQGIDAHALFIGDGEERAAIDARSAALGIENAVTIAGFVNQRALPDWYASVDTLVLPSDSRETWGLVVNEAMAAGLPVIVSDAAGCSVDLVRERDNGFTYPCGDVDTLADRMASIASLGAAGRRAYGNRSRDIVMDFGIDAAVRATEAAVAAVRARVRA